MNSPVSPRLPYTSSVETCTKRNLAASSRGSDAAYPRAASSIRRLPGRTSAWPSSSWIFSMMAPQERSAASISETGRGSVARRRGEVIMVRAVSPLATQLLEEGHPTARAQRRRPATGGSRKARTQHRPPSGTKAERPATGLTLAGE